MPTEKVFSVYIMASKPYGVLYTGVTSDLAKRVTQHKKGLIDGFTKKYFVRRLVYYEFTNSAEGAIKREKSIKRWKREWKIKLVEKYNPNWIDLYDGLM